METLRDLVVVHNSAHSNFQIRRGESSPKEKHAADIGNIRLAQVLAHMPVEAEDQECVDGFVQQPRSQIRWRHVVVLGTIPQQDQQGIPERSFSRFPCFHCLQVQEVNLPE